MKQLGLTIVIAFIFCQSIFGQDHVFKFALFYASPDRDICMTARSEAKSWIKYNADSIGVKNHFKFKRLKFNEFEIDEGLSKDLIDLELRSDSLNLSKVDFENVLLNYQGCIYNVDVNYKCIKGEGNISISFYFNPKGNLNHVDVTNYCF